MPDAGDYVRYWNHDVDAAVVADFGEAGLRRLDANQIIRLVNHDVDGAFVKSARAKGYTGLDVEGFIRLKVHEGEFRSTSRRQRSRPARAPRGSSSYDM